MSESIVTSDEIPPPEQALRDRGDAVVALAGSSATAAYAEAHAVEPPIYSEIIPAQSRRAESDTDMGRDEGYEDADDPALPMSDASISGDLFKQYLKEIGKTPLLNAEQEVELAKRIEAGLYAGRLADKLDGTDEEPLHETEKRAIENAQIYEGPDAEERLIEQLRALEADGLKAKDHMIVANLRLVVSLAKRYQGRGMALLDLTQEGNAGLIRAVEKFDYAKGYKFSTYATWWIRQAITRAIADQARTIRIPVHMVERINKLGAVERRLLRDLGREPASVELAAALDTTVEQIEELKRIRRQPISLSKPLGDGGGIGPGEKDGEFGDLIEDVDATDEAHNHAHHVLRNEALRAHLDRLSEKERRIMELRHGLADGNLWTLERIGKEFGVTRERIRQLETQALKRLREIAKQTDLHDYMSD